MNEWLNPSPSQAFATFVTLIVRFQCTFRSMKQFTNRNFAYDSITLENEKLIYMQNMKELLCEAFPPPENQRQTFASANVEPFFKLTWFSLLQYHYMTSYCRTLHFFFGESTTEERVFFSQWIFNKWGDVVVSYEEAEQWNYKKQGKYRNRFTLCISFHYYTIHRLFRSGIFISYIH